MATKKQQRRRQKLKRHEYEEVYVDDEGRELDPEEAEELVSAAQPEKTAKAKKDAAPQRGRTIEPPSWRRTLRRTTPGLVCDGPSPARQDDLLTSTGKAVDGIGEAGPLTGPT